MHSKIIMPKKALISVTNKTDVDVFGSFLQRSDCQIISTGGTASFLEEHDVEVTEVSEITGFPEIFNGRVKTMHPIITGGILKRRSNAKDEEEAEANGIKNIDLVVVNLYEFLKTVQKGKPVSEIIENIDIGGPCLVRSAAKNYQDVAVVVDPRDYFTVMGMIASLGGISVEMRQDLSERAFAVTAKYDAQISEWYANNRDEIAAAQQLSIS